MNGLDAWSSHEFLDRLSADLDGTELDVESDEGELESAFENAAQDVEAEYRAPYLAHAAMEPMNCTAWVNGDRCEIWTGTQRPLIARKTAAEAADVDVDNVIVHTLLAGGGFGRRFADDAVKRAVSVARTVDFPVQLLYSREDDTASGFYRPAVVAKASAALDGDGQLAAWRYRYSGTASEVDATPYATPAHSVESLEVEQPIPTGPWRSVDHSQHGFFIESFADELAVAANADPFEFRRRHLPEDSRRRKVLDALEERAGWQGRGGNGQGRGVALYECFGTVVGLVIDVSVNDDDLRVDRVLCVADCGIAVNPDQVVAQMESAILYGLSAALSGEITSAAGAIEQDNFHNYPVIRLAEAPEIDVHLELSGAFPFGVGEPGTPPAAPALANAVFSATGVRHRTLPLSGTSS